MMIETLDLLLVFLGILVGLTMFLTLRISIFLRKIEKLYDYFIRSEADYDAFVKKLEEEGKELPPLNAGCPKVEDLEEMP